ncbi:unnamed protein product [Amoebophrya sp. A120]|nr:unnamed protein product [Amoebophrya sp. A120]|eukprot:GSA120T00003581001.1
MASFDNSTIRKLGVIADIQYADVEDGSDFAKTETRYYRNALDVSRRTDFSSCHAIIQLGDIIDGKAVDHTETATKRVIDALDAGFTSSIPPENNNDEDKRKQDDVASRTTNNLKRPYRFDIVGNHELYCGSRSWWRENVWHHGADTNTPDAAHGSLYYSCEVADRKWRLIMLDSYVVSSLGYGDVHKTSTTNEINSPPTHPKLLEAKELLRRENPMMVEALEHPEKKIDYFKGVPLEKQRFCLYNGAFGATQLQWLEAELGKARENQQFVVVFTHVPIMHNPDRKDGGWRTLAWDSDRARQILAGFKQIVVAVYGGHRHRYQHLPDEATGIQHVVVASPMLQTPADDMQCSLVLEFRDNGRITQTAPAGCTSMPASLEIANPHVSL